MKKIFFILGSLFMSVSLLANDPCNVIGIMTGTITTDIVAAPVKANIVGKVSVQNLSPGDNIALSVSGVFTSSSEGISWGILEGVISATILDPVSRTFTGSFVGTGTSIITIEGETESVISEIAGNVVGEIKCDTLLGGKDCGVKLECPAGVKYPYRFCIDGNIVTRCTDDPLTYEDPAAEHFTNPVKANLPIYPMFGVFFPEVMSYFNKYRAGTHDIVLFGEDIIAGEIDPNDYSFIYMRELIEAVDKWNCVCGYETVPSSGGTFLKIEFTDDQSNFRYPYNPYTTPAVADKIDTPKFEQDQETGVISCNLDYNKAIIYFNSTPEYLYGTNKFPDDKNNTPIVKGWVSQQYKHNASSAPLPPTLILNSFLEVAMHEIGHLLGFWNYNSSDTDCDEVEGIMKPAVDDIRRKDITELSLHDKCMFATLYCPDLILGIKEYQKRDCPYINVIPNPTTGEINISFEITGGTNAVSIDLYDAQGRILKTLLSETIYNEGLHFSNSRLDFSVGIYFLRIEIGNKSYFEKIIIEK